METATRSFVAPIGRWSVWESEVAPDGASSSPDVSFVEPMLRRRLSSLARMTLKVANDCAQDLPDVRFVYASRHGELVRTTAMLEALADGEPLSPAVFSMSVLNASAGLFSMLKQNFAPASAISAGPSSFGHGLMEACLQLESNPDRAVLYVYSDEPAPALYGAVDTADSKPRAVGLLLTSSGDLRIQCGVECAGAVTPSSEAQSSAFLRCIEQGKSSWNDPGTTWSWARVQQ